MISVAMTTYNGEKYIEEQVKSILSQTMPVDEIVICDDRSTDHTADVIKRINDKRIKLEINKSNLGYISNFNKAISMTKGKYIFLADQDDIWKSDKVEEMINIMEDKNCSLLCTNFNLIDKNNDLIKEKNNYNIASFLRKNHANDILEISFNRLLLGNIVQGCTYCFTKEIKDKYISVNNHEVVHDWQLILIAAYVGKVLFYNKNLIDYRLHEKNSIGFAQKGDKIQLEKKKPKKVPTMVSLFNDINSVFKLTQMTKIKVWFVFYLRIPYIIAKFRIPI